ncbi:hypothetical protein QYM36_016606 [Artemia franciscana]|uniref:Reverse transcriptase domain-containing protein n=1 Tax=Artemia franciscana TaxID=6661 RepID=A0AA88KV00_ARTSF|nr:hypothetical protein QYM36_016606 [Artemia franciscana]
MVIYPMREHDYDLVGDVNGQEIKSIFKNLKGGTAAGVDGIPILLFKNFLSILIPIIVLLCNKVLRSGQWPSAWKTSLFIPLFKRGNPKAHENYRLIALVPALSKVLEKILDTRLSNWLNTNNLIHEEQGGFRTGYGTTDSVFILKALIDKYGKGKTCLYVGFLDLHKAFDSVDRELLKDAMLNIGLPHSFVRLIVSMYTCVSGIIQVGNRFSKLFDIKRGVKQGSTLSPKLFNIFINDVVNFLENRWAPKVSLGTQKLSLLLFADDIALVANKPQDLQTLLNLIDEYLHIKKLRLNTEKSEVVIFKKRKVGDDEKYTTGATPRLHLGPIGCGYIFSRNDILRQEISYTHGILAYDSEFDQVLESIYGNRKDNYVVIRGISDYVDGTGGRGKEWQAYASLVASSVMKAMILELPNPVQD